MHNATKCVREFHTKMGAPTADAPTLLPCDREAAASLASRIQDLATQTMEASTNEDVLTRRAAMQLEELAEWLLAHADGNLVAAADAWADRAYVLFGDAVAAGLPAAALFAKVHRSNMTKEPDSANTGKAVKGASYEPPRVRRVLREPQD